MTISNEGGDRHFHGMAVQVEQEDEVTSYGAVVVGQPSDDGKMYNGFVLYEGPVTECEAVAAMYGNTSDSIQFAIKNGLNTTDIVQSFRKAATTGR